MTWLWLKLGDNAEYEKYDSLEDVKEFFKELRLTMDFKRHGGYGVKNEEYYGNNYISLFWGDDEAQPIREISDRELSQLNRDRQMSPQLSERKRIRRNPLGYKGFDSSTAYGIISRMHKDITGRYGRVPHRKQVGSWVYNLDSDYILHIRYHGTEVILANFLERRVIKVTTGGYGSVSTKAGISKALYALKRLEYSIPPERGSKYERNPIRFRKGNRIILDPTYWTRFTMDARLEKGDAGTVSEGMFGIYADPAHKMIYVKFDKGIICGIEPESLTRQITPSKARKISEEVKRGIRHNPKSLTLSYKRPPYRKGNARNYYLDYIEPCWGKWSEGIFDSIEEAEKKLSKKFDLGSCEQVWLGEHEDWQKEAYHCGEYWILILRDDSVVVEKGTKFVSKYK